MNEPLAYLNGQYVPAASLSVPVYDAGFMQGTTVAEQLRTFGGRLFRLDEHLARLSRSLEIVGIDPGMSERAMAEVAERLARENHRLLATGDDLGLSIFVTPGPYPTLAPAGASGPTLAMHTYPLPFGLWAEKYRTGQALVVSDIQQVSPRCWPPELKCRSRMHYYLADQRSQAQSPGARALLLDDAGRVCETSTANVMAYYEGEGIVSPPPERILPGISAAALAELAEGLGIDLVHRDLTPGELVAADEVLLTSTSNCLLPVTQLDGQAIGQGRPGPVFERLLRAWGESVGVDIAGQAVQFAGR